MYTSLNYVKHKPVRFLLNIIEIENTKECDSTSIVSAD